MDGLAPTIAAPPSAFGILADMEVMQRHVDLLRGVLHDLTTHKTQRGPGMAGREALAAYGGISELRQLICSYDYALGDLARASRLRTIGAAVRTLWPATGIARAAKRDGIRRLIAEHREAA